jgi:hypothetical protein
MVFRNSGNLLQHYIASQPGRPRLKSSPWKPPVSHQEWSTVTWVMKVAGYGFGNQSSIPGRSRFFSSLSRPDCLCYPLNFSTVSTMGFYRSGTLAQGQLHLLNGLQPVKERHIIYKDNAVWVYPKSNFECFTSQERTNELHCFYVIIISSVMKLCTRIQIFCIRQSYLYFRLVR